jgi:hypothetical protein
MVRTLATVAALWVSVAASAQQPSPPKCIPAAQCCMICDEGKSCGNSCISRAKTCHKGRGCSCNASEVCPAE